MKLVGVDYDSHGRYYAMIEDGKLIDLAVSKFGTQRRFEERTRESALNFVWGSQELEFLEWDWLAIEGYSHRVDTYGQLAWVYWDMRRWATPTMKVLDVPSASWKKGIGLKGNATKPDVKKRILELYPEIPANLRQDFYDAVGVAHAAWRIVTLEQA
jgi:hypothetical protein